MKALMALVSVCLVFFLASPLLMSCNKSESSDRGRARLQVSLTDDPGNYEEVLIDVQSIQVNFSRNDNEGWQSLEGVKTGSYDLLKLVNDKDTVLADAEIPSGRLHQLRLTLGPENYVKINGARIRLNTPATQQSGLNLKIQQVVANGIQYKILLDFDVAKSIVDSGNGEYTLKPVIRTVFETIGGSIKGWVSPGYFKTTISAIQGSDTIAGTFTGDDGGFILKGLAQGDYSLHFNPSDTTYLDSLILGIPVINKEVTGIDTVFLHP